MSKAPPVCNYWLVKQGTPNSFLNYEGGALKICTRCRGSYYINQEAQKKHWKTHKKYCKLLDDGYIQTIDSTDDLDRCIAAIMACLQNTESIIPQLYYEIKRLRALFDADVEGVGDAAFRLHSMARGLIFYGDDKMMMQVVAVPRMANLFFSDEEDLLSKKNRFIRQNLSKYNGRPSEEYVEDIEDEDERKEAKKLVEKYDELDSTWGQPSSMSFCYLYFNLIVACALHGNQSMSSVHDGNGKLRGGDPRKKSNESLLSTAALRRAMELWTDPLVLGSCGDAMAPAASLALTAIEYYTEISMLSTSPLCGKHEVVPGLAIDRLAMTCMSELSEGAGSAQYSVKLLKMVGSMVTGWESTVQEAPWKDMPIERRARFALAAIQYIGSADERSTSSFGRDIDVPFEALNDMLKTMCGMQNPKDEELAKSVWQKAADDGEMLGPDGAGFNMQLRSFFYYLLRRSILPEDWKDLDMVKVYKEYSAIPMIDRAPDDEQAKEKDDCMRLAYGDERHEKRNAMFRDIFSR